VEAGVQALRESWVAAMQGVPLARHAARVPALAAALEFWR
jgi:ribulose-bisphosphate carboxylase large chain